MPLIFSTWHQQGVLIFTFPFYHVNEYVVPKYVPILCMPKKLDVVALLVAYNNRGNFASLKNPHICETSLYIAKTFEQKMQFLNLFVFMMFQKNLIFF